MYCALNYEEDKREFYIAIDIDMLVWRWKCVALFHLVLRMVRGMALPVCMEVRGAILLVVVGSSPRTPLIGGGGKP